MKKKIEKWAVNKLYWHGFHRFGRINKKKRKIIFDWQGRILFGMWPNRTEILAITLLTKFYGYTCWEEQLCFFVPKKPQFEHTWGEIQDIIMQYNRIRIKPVLSDKVSNLDSSEPKSDVLPVTPSDN